MAPEEPNFWNEVLRQMLTSGAWSTLAFGAAGGATNALVTKTPFKEAVRLTTIGSLVAFGAGSLSMAVLASSLNLPADLIPVGGMGGSAAYLMGIFGGAFIEMALARFRRRAQAPEGGTDV